jgi:acylphosphatase
MGVLDLSDVLRLMHVVGVTYYYEDHSVFIFVEGATENDKEAIREQISSSTIVNFMDIDGYDRPERVGSITDVEQVLFRKKD